jgi:uncharacterized delta-60 repeat protein
MKTSTLFALIASFIVKTGFSQDGSLDTGFSLDGRDVVDFNAQDDFGYPAITQPDNKIIVAGETYSGSSYDFAVLRYTESGVPDSTFSGDGKLIIDWSGSDDFANSLAIQPDGKILVAGSAGVGIDNQFALIRLLPDGTADSSFSNDGMLTTQVGSAGAPLATLVQPDGKIILAGYSFNSDIDFTLIRYLPNGDPDSTFGVNGIAVTPVGTGDDTGVSAVLQPDGRIIMTGYLSNGSDLDIVVARYNNDGTLDTSFNSIGYTITDVSSANNYGRGVGVMPDGKIIVGGYTEVNFSNDFILLRYDQNGLPDTSFNSDGQVITDVSNGDDVAISMTIQPDNKIVLAGYANTGANSDFAVVRYNPDGSLDSTFDADGKVTTDFNNTSDIGTLITQGDNRLTLGGYTLNPTGADFATVSYLCEACKVQGNIATATSEILPENIAVALYPNPVSDQATFNYSIERDVVSLKLYDLHGRMVESFMNNEPKEKGSHAAALEFVQLPAGMYFLVLSGESTFQVIKMVKEDN